MFKDKAGVFVDLDELEKLYHLLMRTFNFLSNGPNPKLENDILNELVELEDLIHELTEREKR